jgi:mannose-6-phosphate isomerase-like protein (cupin superfamily)
MKKLLLAAALMLPSLTFGAAVLAQAPAPAPAPAQAPGAAPAAGRGAPAPWAPAPPLATTRASDGQAVVVTAEQITALAQRARQGYNAAATKTPNMRQIVIDGTPYALGLEHRVGKATASIHNTHAELMIVIEGSGLYTTDGTLVNPGPLSGGAMPSIVGSDIANGTVRQINKGDIFIVPEGKTHMLTPDPGGPLLIATIHVPRLGAWAAPAADAGRGGRGGNAQPKLMHLAADTAPIIATARAQLPTAARFFAGGTLISLPPYRVGLELRSPKGIASVHKNNAEFMWVLEGEGIIETGGTVVNPRDTGANIDGDSQQGSTINRMKKGDFIFVPKGVPHLARSEGTFVLATMHVPGDAP